MQRMNTGGGADGRRPRLLFVVNVDWFFLSHRLPLALGARDAGVEVMVAAGDTGRAGEIRAQGLEFVPLPITRDGTGMGAELATMAALARLYRRVRADMVHHVTIKPVLYGSVAARVAPGMAIVNAISGLGYVFSQGGRPLLRAGAQAAYRVALGGPRTRTIFQNPEDRDEFVRKGLVKQATTVLIRGSGVDPARFVPAPEPAGDPIVMLASRMLWEKGVGEFVEAARALRGRGVRARFVLVGPADPGNPTGVPAAQLRAWADEGVVEWWGERTDMHHVLAQAAVVTLPSFYKEGLPKVLLEAAAAGKPLVATDIPGCREIVLPGRNGELIPPRDAPALAAAVGALLDSPALRARYGAAGRALAEAEFTEARVVAQTLAVYRELLGDRWPATPSREPS
jgi:glycosyltransferase involved in cell wall biosynthesis